MIVLDDADIDAAVLDGVKPGMRLYDEESFGPVKPVIRVKDEAVAVANDTEYGLPASVYSHDIRRAMAVAARIESGICHINGPALRDEKKKPAADEVRQAFRKNRTATGRRSAAVPAGVS